MQADTYIPRRLDDPWKIGFWDVDVAAPILFGMFLGYMSGSKVSFALCIVTGLLTSRWIARIKADKHPAFAMHWLYWHLPTSPITAMRATPPSHIRQGIGISSADLSDHGPAANGSWGVKGQCSELAAARRAVQKLLPQSIGVALYGCG